MALSICILAMTVVGVSVLHGHLWIVS